MLKPTENRVLVQQHQAEQMTPGGIVIPELAKEAPRRGTIVEVGPGIIMEDGLRKKMEVKKGDVVIFAKYTGAVVQENGIDYILMRDNDVLAVVE